jgi:hypothetical protein
MNPKQPPTLLRIEAPHFTAGAEVAGNDHIITRTAPIIAYMTGWTVFRAMAYAHTKRWKTLWIKA